MPLNYAEKYSPIVDERFALGALTNGIVNNNYDWVGVETIHVFSRDLATVGDYSMTGTSRYGTPTDLGNQKQDLTLSQDRAFTYIIDRKTEMNTVGTMEAAATLAENIDQVMIPEIDTYRIAQLVAGAPSGHVKTAAVTAANAYEEFLAVQEMLDDDKAPAGGRRVLVTPAFLNKIKLDENFVKRGDLATEIGINGVVGEIDGVTVIKAPTSYFPENVDFVITHPAVMPAPIKLAELKIHDNPQGISGWLVEARFYYDAFVLNNKKNAIGVHKNA